MAQDWELKPGNVQVLLDVFTFGPILNGIALAYISIVVDGEYPCSLISEISWPCTLSRCTKPHPLPVLEVLLLPAGRSIDFTKQKLKNDYPGVVFNAWKVIDHEILRSLLSDVVRW